MSASVLRTHFSVAPDQIGPVAQQPDGLLDRQRHAVGPLLEEGRESLGDVFPVEHRRHQLGGLGHVQRAKADPYVPGACRGSGGQPHQHGVRRHVLGTVGQHQAHPAGPAGGEEQQEVQGGSVGPVDVLQDQHADAHGVQQFGQCAEESVPSGARVRQRLGGRRQILPHSGNSGRSTPARG